MILKLCFIFCHLKIMKIYQMFIKYQFNQILANFYQFLDFINYLKILPGWEVAIHLMIKECFLQFLNIFFLYKKLYKPNFVQKLQKYFGQCIGFL